MSPKPLLILREGGTSSQYCLPPIIPGGGEWFSGAGIDSFFVYQAPTAEEMTAFVEKKISELSSDRAERLATLEADNSALKNAVAALGKQVKELLARK